MRTRTSTWFETKIRYEKMMEDGMQKKVTEQYVVDALSFTEAESSIIDEMSVYISGEMDITDIKHATYGEIFLAMLMLTINGTKPSYSLSPSTRKQKKKRNQL